MKLARYLPLAVLGLLALAVPLASADSCGAVYQRRAVATPYVAAASYATPVVAAVAPIEVATYNAQAVLVPSYAAYYQGAQASAPAPASLSPEALELLRQMGSRLDGIEQHLRRGQAVDPTPLPPLPPKVNAPTMPPAVSLGGAKGYTSCLKCHDGAADKAKGHVLFAAGQPTQWDCATLLEIEDRVTRASGSEGVMPPDGSATDEEVAGIIAALKVQAKQLARK